MSYTRVIVGTDGSTTASRAVATASRVAAALEVELVVLTAWQRRPPDPPAPSEEAAYPAGGGVAGAAATWATTTTSDAAAIARQHGVAQVRQLQPVGAPGDALLETAEQHPGALIVVGTWGLADRAERLVGNVPHALTHHSPVDLLLSTGEREEGWRRVALATDGSATSVTAVRHGLALTRALAAEPTLLTAARDEERGQRVLDAAAEQLGGEAASLPRAVARDGDVSRTLVTAGADYDLLVLGNKGMSGPSRLLGSVANRITHQVPTDLLLINTTR